MQEVVLNTELIWMFIARSDDLMYTSILAVKASSLEGAMRKAEALREDPDGRLILVWDSTKDSRHIHYSFL